MKKYPLIIPMFFFLFGIFEARSQVDTYKESIEKAENLILQKDRDQAIQVLLNALQREKNKTTISELKKKIEELGSVFLSDKAQQHYETALSLKRKNISQALAKMNEASRIEPDNIQIISELVRLNILKNDCNKAQDLILKFYNKNKYDENILLSMAQVQQCLSASDQYFSVRSYVDPKKITESYDWQILELQREIFEKDKLKAKERLASLLKWDAKNPQNLYWQWSLEKLENRERNSLREKYNLSCNNISVGVFRKYMRDPYFCNKQSEMEADAGKK